MFIGQTVSYLELIVFIWEKASSYRLVDPKNAGKRRAIDHTEGQIHFDRDQQSGGSRLFGDLPAVPCTDGERC